MKMLVLLCLLTLSCSSSEPVPEKAFTKMLDPGIPIQVKLKPWPPAGGRTSIFVYYPHRVGGPEAFRNLQVRAVKERNSKSMFETMERSEDRLETTDGDPGALQGYEYQALDYQVPSGKVYLQLRNPHPQGPFPVAEWELDVP